MRNLLYFLSVLFYVSLFAQTEWAQIGPDINGAQGDGLGNAVSLSADGNTVAIGASFGPDGASKGIVRIYFWNGTTWAQKGSDLLGDADSDSFGQVVSLSDDGNTLAVSAPTRDDPATAPIDRTPKGQVKVFAWESNVWVQKFSVNGTADFGFLGTSISLSGNGARLSVGIPGEGDFGTVRIYENTTSWAQIGSDIIGSEAQSNFGESVALDQTGTTLAIGNSFFTVNDVFFSGQVRVYSWSGTSWGLKGSVLNGGEDDAFGASVSLSDDGNRLVVGAPDSFFGLGPTYFGYAQVFDFSTDWNSIGTITSDLDMDSFGKAVAISGDGTHVISGATGYLEGTNPNGRVKIYKQVASAWEQVGTTLSGEGEFDNFGGTVALSSSGLRLAVGASANQGGGPSAGHVRIFEFGEGTAGPTPPSLSITTPSSTVSASFVATFAFSEPVADFALEDISVANGSASGFNGTGATYTATITPTTNGAVTISVAANAAFNANQDGNSAASLMVTYIDGSGGEGGSSQGPYDVSAAVFNQSKNIFSTVQQPTGLQFSPDGLKLFVSEEQGVLQSYTLTTAFDISTITASMSLDLSTQEYAADIQDFEFNASGTELYLIGATTDLVEFIPVSTVFKVVLSQGFNLSSAGAPEMLNIESQEDFGTSIELNGNTLFILGQQNATIKTFDITNFTSATPSAASLNLQGVEAFQTESMRFSHDGKKLLILNFDFNLESIRVISYTLSTAYDLTTAAYDGANEEFTGISFNDIFPAGLAFNNEGSQMYVTGATMTGADIREYTIEIPEPQEVTVVISNVSKNPTNGPFTFDITFSESVTGFDSNGINADHDAQVAIQGTGANYIASVTPSTFNGTYTFSVKANAAFSDSQVGNLSSNQLEVVYDNVAPTVTITGPDVAPNTDPVHFTITFSEPVTDFTLDGLLLVNFLEPAEMTGSGATYTLIAAVNPQATEAVTIQVSADAAMDAAGNKNTSSNVFEIDFDRVRPTYQFFVFNNITAVNNTEPIFVGLNWSEPIRSFVASDITVENGAVTGFEQDAQIPTFYGAYITPDGIGDISIGVAADKVLDIFGNGNAASDASVIRYDIVQPTVTITEAPSGVNSLTPFTIAITFSEEIVEFEIGDIQVTHGFVSNFHGSGSAYTAEITPNGNDHLAISIAADVANDVAGNLNLASNNVTVIYDAVRPTVTITPDPTTLIIGNITDIAVSMVFSEIVTGFTFTNANVTNGTVSNFTGSDDIYSVTVIPTGAGSVVISIPEGAAVDALGNTLEANQVTIPLIYTYSGGTGTLGDPFLIADKTDLIYLITHSAEWNKYFRQTADISFNGSFTSTIGTQSNAFIGSYDGGGHVITGISGSNPMFGYVSNSTLTNIHLKEVSINGLAGLAINNGSGSLISNCSVSGTITVVGPIYQGGGLVRGNSGTIRNSFTIGELTNPGSFEPSYSGGIASGNSGTVENSYSLMSVTLSSGDILKGNGGLIGINSGILSNSYFGGSVNQSSYSGALVGNNSGTISSSYYNNEEISSGTGSHSSVAGGTGLTTTQMQDQASFTNWDFIDETTNGTDDIWQMDNGCNDNDYPILAWQENPTLPSLSVPASNLTFPVDEAIVLTASTSGTAVIRWYATADSETVLHEGDVYEPTLSSGSHSIWVSAEIQNCSSARVEIVIYVQYPYSGGEGNLGSPYRIATKEDLLYLSENSNEWNYHFEQDGNIVFETADFQNGGFSPIGNLTSPFSGSYAGNNFIIEGLEINNPNDDFVGLFGYINSEVSITSLGLKNVNITGKNYVGGIVGQNDGNISNTYVTGSVTGANFVGGLIGRNTGPLSTAYVTGSITGTTHVGGLIGWNDYFDVENTYVSATVQGTTEVGAMIGHNAGIITLSIWNSDATVVSGVGFGDGTGVSGKTTNEMRTQSTFEESQWDFVTKWVMPSLHCTNNGLPILQWQNNPSVSYTIDEIPLICSGETATLSITTDSPVVRWFASENATQPLATGKTYTTSAITESTGYWFEVGDETCVQRRKELLVTVTKVTISAPPVISVCNITSLTLSATPTPSTAQVSWYTSQTSTEAIATGLSLNVENVPTQETTYWVEASENGCISERVKIVVTIPQYCYSGGQGSKDNPFLIANKDDLHYLSNNSSQWLYHFRQVADITFAPTDFENGGTFYNNGKGFSPIGANSSYYYYGYNYKGFTGSYDGDEFSISGLKITRNDYQYNIGMFGYVAAGAKVFDLNLTNVNITGYYQTGAVAGLSDGTISNCSVSGSLSSNNNRGYYIGGIVGRSNGTIENCDMQGLVNGYYYVGGIVGYAEAGTLDNNHNSASVSSNYYTGGIAGQSVASITNCSNEGAIQNINSGSNTGGIAGHSTGSITSCHNTGTINGYSNIGGLAGYHKGGAITDSYNSGAITSTYNYGYVGGLVGQMYGGDLIRSYNTGTINSSGYAGGLVGYTYYSYYYDYGSSEINITNCYNIGDITSNQTAAGLVAYMYFGSITDSYNEGEVNVTPGENYYSAYAGGLVAYLGYSSSSYSSNQNNAIVNSHNKGVVSASGSNSYAGGIVANWYGGTIDNCYNEATISSQAYAGGIVAYAYDDYYYSNEDQVMKNTYNVGEITASGTSQSSSTYAGGLVGYSSSIQMDNCYNQGVVTSSYVAGGLIGYQYRNYSNKGSISKSYNSGAVSATEKSSYAGGLVGQWTGGSITNSNNQAAVTAKYAAGGIAGSFSSYSSSSTASNLISSYNSGAISSTGENSTAGGLVAVWSGGSLNKSYNLGNVSASQYVGGIAGNTSSSYNTGITHSYNKGTITGTSVKSYAGGLIGYWYRSQVENSYNSGEVKGPGVLGGLIGYGTDYYYYSDNNKIRNSHNAGVITPEGSAFEAGGLVGKMQISYYSNQDLIVGSFWDTEISGRSTSASGGTGKTTAEMQTLTTFTNAVWDFTGSLDPSAYPIWVMDVAGTGYPILYWQGNPAVTISGKITDENGQPFTAGKASTPRKINGAVGTDETRKFTIDNEGNYTLQLIAGEYLVKVTPTDANTYFTTYLGNTIQQGSANTIIVSSTDLTGQDIQMIARSPENLLTGQGKLKGNVVQGGNARLIVGRLAEGTPVVGASVFLIRTSDEKIMTEVVTDASGQYTINGIPNGDYKIYINIDGMPMDLGNSTITFTNQTAEIVVGAVVGPNGIQLSVEVVLGLDNLSGLRMYPNPVSTELQIELKGTNFLRVIDMKGTTLVERTFSDATLLDVTSMANGVHFIEITNAKGDKAVRKLVKRN